MGSRACYLNSLRKYEPRTVNVIITDLNTEACVDKKMLDVSEQEHASKQEKDIEMIEAPKEGHHLDELDPQIIESEPNATPVKELESFPTNPQDPTQVLRIGKTLFLEIKRELMNFLKWNLDVLAW